MPMPGTARKSESVLGHVLAMLRNVRSPKMRKAGILRRLASVNRQARKACSRRACRSGGGAAPLGADFASLPCAGTADAAIVARFLLRLVEVAGPAASLITKRWAWLSLKVSPAGKILTLR